MTDDVTAKIVRPWEVFSQDQRTIFCVDRTAGDDPDLDALFAELPPIQRMNQVHGCGVHEVSAPRSSPQIPDADAIVSGQSPVTLLVRTADCVPVVLWDRHSAVTAVVHAGWRGFVAGVIPAAVTAMTSAGASVNTISAWVGPSICSQCYEVGMDVQHQIVAVSAAALAQTNDGQPAADVAAGVTDQLRALGITEIAYDMRCTKQTPSLYSARGGDQVQRLQFVVSVDVRD